MGPLACHRIQRVVEMQLQNFGYILTGEVLPPAVRRGLLGPDGAPATESPLARRRVPYGSVHQSCNDMGQLSDPSRLVGSSRAKSGFSQTPDGSQYDLTSPDEPQRVSRLTLICVRLIFRPLPIQHPMGSRRAHSGPGLTQRTRSPDMVRQRATWNAGAHPSPAARAAGA